MWSRSEEDEIMFRKPVITGIVLITATVVVPFAGRAAALVELKSITVDLPDSDRTFPSGPGSDAINDNCLACHSAGMVLNQPPMSTAQWQAEVNKMRTAYKAPIDPKDVGAIVNYLAALRGAKS
jgi:hypothetical protein